MKLLWLCNMVPGAVKKAITGKDGNGLWVDHVLQDLRQQENLEIRVFCPYKKEKSGQLDDRCSYHTFRTKLPHQYLPELEEWFAQELEAFQPDVIHSWGVEYAHSLAMANAAEKTGYLDRMAVSIQGLCCYIAGHYCEGIPYAVQHSATFRDFLRKDNIAQQQKKFILRGELEQQTLRKVSHIIGRTHWDKACTAIIHPEAKYHVCNETLRDPFYQGTWQYDSCRKYRIFAPSCSYPVKGFHHLLTAFADVAKTYPEAVIAVPGKSYLKAGFLRRNSYQKYLAKLTHQYGLEGKIEFLGSLNAEGMKENLLKSHVFAMPSTIENSPNALGEAMILGVPSVAADVGGVTTLMNHNREGFVYQSTAPYMLAYFIKSMFAMEEQAAELGLAAKEHALQIHDPEANLQALLKIYEEIAK